MPRFQPSTHPRVGEGRGRAALAFASLLLVAGCVRTETATPLGAEADSTTLTSVTTSVAEDDCIHSLTGGIASRAIEGCDGSVIPTGFPTRTLPPITPLPTMPPRPTETGTRYGAPSPYAQTIPGNGAGWAASGSGCVPGVSDYLPDGIWFGFVLGFEAGPSGSDAVQFDMGCFYEGSAAIEEAAHDSVYASGNIYVRNVSRLIFVAPVAFDAVVAYLDSAGYHQPAGSADWPHVLGNELIPCPGPRCGVWLYVEDGWVVLIQEQVTR